jgi:isopenicillin-N epimerase
MTAASTLPAPSPFFDRWTLEPGTVFLNHGSFGAVPRDVQAAQDRYRAQMEAEPIRFMVEELRPGLDLARRAAAELVGCTWRDIAPIPNATVGVATVMDNLRLKPGDEILVNDHEYPACCNSARRLAARYGATVSTLKMPFPVQDEIHAAESVLAALTPRTKVVLLSHVTSPTGMILPVERVLPELEKRGIISIIDGAHAPGFVSNLNITALERLGCCYYTANFHKWICTPKGSAMLWVRSDLQRDFRPLALSNNAEKPIPGRSQFLTEFDFVGSADYTPFLCLPDAIACLSAMVPGGLGEVTRRNRELVLAGRKILCDALHIEAPVPESMIGNTATIILPPHAADRQARLWARPTRYADALQDNLVDKHRIQVPVWPLSSSGQRLLRISAQLYNTRAQYEYLAAALVSELAAERAS